MHARLRGYTVNNVERVVVVQRSDTTNAHRGSTRGVTVGGNVHARHAALQGFHRVVLVLLGYFVDADRRNGTRQVGLALRGIAHHHHLGQFGGIFLHRHLHAVLGRQLLCVEADVGNHQCGTGRHLHLEIAVDVGNDTVRRSLFHNGSTDDGFTLGVNHGTCDFLLRVHHCAEQRNK